jgi:hypothetical protein
VVIKNNVLVNNSFNPTSTTQPLIILIMYIKVYIEWGQEKVSSPTAPANIIGWGCGTQNFKSQQRVSGPADIIYFYNKVKLGLFGPKKISI